MANEILRRHRGFDEGRILVEHDRALDGCGLHSQDSRPSLLRATGTIACGQSHQLAIHLGRAFPSLWQRDAEDGLFRIMIGLDVVVRVVLRGAFTDAGSVGSFGRSRSSGCGGVVRCHSFYAVAAGGQEDGRDTEGCGECCS